MKTVYIICSSIEQLVILAGSSWFVFNGGSFWWLVGGVLLVEAIGIGARKRMNSWGDMGEVE